MGCVKGVSIPHGVSLRSGTVFHLFRQVVSASQNSRVHLDLFSFWQNIVEK